MSGIEPLPVQIELQLTSPEPQALSQQNEEPRSETSTAAVATNLMESVADTEPKATKPAPLTVKPDQTLFKGHEAEHLSRVEINRIVSSVLAAQFISEEPLTDRLFGRPKPQVSGEKKKGFHYPVRQDMISMLDQPMPDLPFAYQRGLVRFAYDPGVKGDLQRFWDVITPEFGWRTRNGTEFKCIWILVIAGCGWK